MEEIIANDDALNVEQGKGVTPPSTETVDVAALQARNAELEDANSKLFARAKTAEGSVKVDGKWVKAPKPEEAIATAQRLEATTGELSETQLDFLDVKGITAEEDIAVIQAVIKRTGQTVRQVLADDYVVSKLKSNKDARDVQNATPSSIRRTGQSENNDVDFHLAQYERTGKLPDDFDMRSKVIDAKAAKGSDSIPPWRR